MRHKLIRTGSVIAALGLAALALLLLFTAVRRVQVAFKLALEGGTMPGVVMENISLERSDRLLPFPVEEHVVRYAYPSPQGQMHTGEQVVLARVARRIGEQGTPVDVVIIPDDPTVSAVMVGIAFPGIAGWRMGMAIGAALLSTAAALVSTGVGTRYRGE